MRQNPLQLAAGRAGSCRADSTCRHQSEKGLVILAHFPFGPRGSTVSGRQLYVREETPISCIVCLSVSLTLAASTSFGAH